MLPCSPVPSSTVTDRSWITSVISLSVSPQFAVSDRPCSLDTSSLPFKLSHTGYGPSHIRRHIHPVHRDLWPFVNIFPTYQNSSNHPLLHVIKLPRVRAPLKCHARKTGARLGPREPLNFLPGLYKSLFSSAHITGPEWSPSGMSLLNVCPPFPFSLLSLSSIATPSPNQLHLPPRRCPFVLCLISRGAP